MQTNSLLHLKEINGYLIDTYEQILKRNIERIKEVYPLCIKGTEEGEIAFQELNARRDNVRRVTKILKKCRKIQKELKKSIHYNIEFDRIVKNFKMDFGDEIEED